MKKPFAGAARVVVLDNLREGVLAPDIDDSTLNPGVLRIMALSHVRLGWL